MKASELFSAALNSCPLAIALRAWSIILGKEIHSEDKVGTPWGRTAMAALSEFAFKRLAF